MSDQPKILVHVSLPETDQTLTFWNFWKIANQGWPLVDVPPGRTDQQRNMALEALKKSDGTHLVLLDHDHLHPADIVHRLAQHVIDDPDKYVVSGLNFSRHDGSPAASVIVDGEVKPLDGWDTGVVEVFSTGAAAMIISREIFDTPADFPFFAYGYPPDESRKTVYHPGTDYFFCEKMRLARVKMYVDTTLVSPHLIRGTVPEMRPMVRAKVGTNREVKTVVKA